MIRLGLVHTTDFRELPVGGTLTSLRRFLAHHDRQAFRTDLIGFDFNRAPADDVVTVSDRTFRFVSCGRIRLVDGRRPVVPVRLRSLLAGWFRRGRFRAGGYDVLLVHNVDILFSLAGGVDCPIVLQAHGVLENAARFSRYRFARLRLFQALYRRMVGQVLRRCAFIVSVNEEGRAFYLRNIRSWRTGWRSCRPWWTWTCSARSGRPPPDAGDAVDRRHRSGPAVRRPAVRGGKTSVS